MDATDVIVDDKNLERKLEMQGWRYVEGLRTDEMRYPEEREVQKKIRKTKSRSLHRESWEVVVGKSLPKKFSKQFWKLTMLLILRSAP